MSIACRFSVILVVLCFVFGFSGCIQQEEYSAPAIVDSRPVYRPTLYKNQPLTNTYKRKHAIAKTDNSFYSNISLSGKTIIVDPGHGGKDPGAGEVGYSSVPEKRIVLAIGRELAQNLEKCGARVIMTRSDDRFLELEERAAIADRYNADLFVSVHADSAPGNTSAQGPTLYIARGASSQSRIASMKMHSTLNDWGFDCRGVRRADYKVLVNHSRPAVLVECGYLTNWQDAKKLNSSWYQSRIARALADAICQM